MKTVSVRIWDLPTRLFHWLLALCVVALIVTAKIGGNAMEWHLRLGHAVLALLAFRLVWGVAGGHWSRFAVFVPRPAQLAAYLRGGLATVGHNPLGALSVLAMLAVLIVQVLSGLASDDEIAFAGPLTRWVSGETVAWATQWHKGWGQWLVIGLIALHLCAIAYYTLVRRQRLVASMLHGHQAAPAHTPFSRDQVPQRLLALVVFALCAVAAWWLYRQGGTPVL